MTARRPDVTNRNTATIHLDKLDCGRKDLCAVATSIAMAVAEERTPRTKVRAMTMKTMSLITSPRDFALHCWPAIALLVVLVLALVGYAAWPRMTATTSTAATSSTTATTSGWSRV